MPCLQLLWAMAEVAASCFNACFPSEAQQSLWAELQSAAESGWDFSSRWFLPGFPSLQDPLQDTQVRGIVPVDLNAILCKVEQLLATFYQVLGEKWGNSLMGEGLPLARWLSGRGEGWLGSGALVSHLPGAWRAGVL